MLAPRLLAVTLAGAAAMGIAAAAMAQTPAPSLSPPATASPAPLPPSATPVPAAGTIPATLTVTVTGSSVGERFLTRQITAALNRAIRPTLQPGASIAYGPIVVPQPVSPGNLTSVAVQVTLSGVGLATVSAATSVQITNLTLEPKSPATLLFDDDPEYVALPGLLASTTIDADSDRRLYYYHDDAGLPVDIAVVLSAASASRVQLIDAEGGPDLDVMSVGDQVSRTFLHDEPRNEGIVVDVTPDAPLVLRSSLTLVGELVAGMVDIRVLAGGPVTASVVAVPPGQTPASALTAPRVPRDGHHRHGLFDISSYGTQTIAYTAGGPDASEIYGGRNPTPPNVDSDDGHDYGDYGVLRTITFDVANPTASPSPLFLYEEPRGGPVRSAFLVDGKLTTLGCARVEQRYQITEFNLPPGTNGAITLVTTTDGGSNYPLEVGVTATPPLPQTPPINAPDGCFPKPAASSPPASPAPSPSSSASPSPSPAQTAPATSGG